MAGYRPKSLDELNEMYDKTITAEKAIIKATKHLHDVTETIVPSHLPEDASKKEEENNAVEGFSSDVDLLINRFREEAKTNVPREIKKSEPPVIKEPPSSVSLQKNVSEKEVMPEVPDAKAFENSISAPPSVPSKPKVHYSIDAPEEIQQKANAKSDERTDLFNDYMKIMNDEDDDFFSKHESYKKKDKKKKHKKGFFFRHEPKTEEIEENVEDEASLPQNESQSAYEDDNNALPLKEVIYSPEVPEALSNLKMEFEADEDESAEDFSSFTDYTPSETAEKTSPISEDADEDTINNQPTYKNEQAAHPDFDIMAAENEELPPVPEEIADKTFEDFMSNSDDIYSFDPSKKNTIPEYAQEQYPEEDNNEYDIEDSDEDSYPGEDTDSDAAKNTKGIVAGRVILSIVLSLLCVLTVGIVGINTLLNVNTGKATFGEKFIFTATQNYTNSNILDGDLIITEKRYANDGEIFAYINYTQQCFMFGKRNGSIVNDSGDVLFIAENDGERVLVLRDDTRGVVVNTYPEIGGIITVCTEFFIPIVASLLLIVLIIILLLSFVFKDKEKAYNKMMKKMVKKGVIPADEVIEEAEDEEENLFSTIE